MRGLGRTKHGRTSFRKRSQDRTLGRRGIVPHSNEALRNAICNTWACIHYVIITSVILSFQSSGCCNMLRGMLVRNVPRAGLNSKFKFNLSDLSDSQWILVLTVEVPSRCTRHCVAQRSCPNPIFPKSRPNPAIHPQSSPMFLRTSSGLPPDSGLLKLSVSQFWNHGYISCVQAQSCGTTVRVPVFTVCTGLYSLYGLNVRRGWGRVEHSYSPTTCFSLRTSCMQ